MTKTLLCLAMTLAFAGCSKKDDGETKRQAALCQQAEKLMRDIAADQNSDKQGSATQTAMEAGMLSCSKACDGGDKPSCGTLHSFTSTLCDVTPAACKQLCDTVKSPSLKAEVCAPPAKK